jgi:hypothetical protein
MDFKLEHLLLFVVAIFLLYHLLGGCGCANGVDGFSVGGQSCSCIWKEDGQCKQQQSGKTFNEDTCTSSTDQYDCVHQEKYGYSIPICKWDDGIGKLNNKIDTITKNIDYINAGLNRFENIMKTNLVIECHDEGIRNSDGILTKSPRQYMCPDKYKVSGACACPPKERIYNDYQ